MTPADKLMLYGLAAATACLLFIALPGAIWRFWN